MIQETVTTTAIMREAGKNLVTVMMMEVMAMEARVILVAVMAKILKNREVHLLSVPENH
jgi:hypothetical protein